MVEVAQQKDRGKRHRNRANEEVAASFGEGASAARSSQILRDDSESVNAIRERKHFLLLNFLLIPG